MQALPAELVAYIANLLPLRDVYRLSLTCKWMHSCVLGSDYVRAFLQRRLSVVECVEYGLWEAARKGLATATMTADDVGYVVHQLRHHDHPELLRRRYQPPRPTEAFLRCFCQMQYNLAPCPEWQLGTNLTCLYTSPEYVQRVALECLPDNMLQHMAMFVLKHTDPTAMFAAARTRKLDLRGYTAYHICPNFIGYAIEWGVDIGNILIPFMPARERAELLWQTQKFCIWNGDSKQKAFFCVWIGSLFQGLYFNENVMEYFDLRRCADPYMGWINATILENLINRPRFAEVYNLSEFVAALPYSRLSESEIGHLYRCVVGVTGYRMGGDTQMMYYFLRNLCLTSVCWIYLDFPEFDVSDDGNRILSWVIGERDKATMRRILAHPRFEWGNTRDALLREAEWNGVEDELQDSIVGP